MIAATPGAIARAAAVLRAGGLVAFPTETVYGLGADATDGRAVARIFAAKGRPRFNPLISHVLDRAAGERQAIFDSRAVTLAEALWPGPLTLVLARRDDCEISELALCGLATVALRCPRGAVARALLEATAGPIAAPSANRSGGLSPTTAAHVAADLGDAPAMILDGGPCPVGVESTIVDLSVSPAALLRPGAVTAAEIAALIGPLATADDDAAAPKAPGRLARHYAPDTPLRLNATVAAADEALLAFGPGRLREGARPVSRGPGGSRRGGSRRPALCVSRRFDSTQLIWVNGLRPAEHEWLAYTSKTECEQDCR